MFIHLTDDAAVAPQLAPADMAEAAARGFTVIVNNRPDGEERDQPACATMRAAAEKAGLAYTAIPVDQSGFGRDQVDAMAAVLADAPGPVLAFCRSGTRSAHLWALAEASRGKDPDSLIAAAAAGGYDLRALGAALRQLSAAARP